MKKKDGDGWHVISTKMKEYKNSTPFKGIKSRHAIAVMLSFVEKRDKVIDLM